MMFELPRVSVTMDRATSFRGGCPVTGAPLGRLADRSQHVGITKRNRSRGVTCKTDYGFIESPSGIAIAPDMKYGSPRVSWTERDFVRQTHLTVFENTRRK